MRKINLRTALLIASICIYCGGQIWQCISWPPFYSFDETLEVDYVYQITQGHLPSFFDGPEFNPLHLQYPYDVQWRYQHPPLFYLIQAPVFMVFDTLHHPIRGIWAMRGMETMLGICVIFASSWAARRIIGRSNAITALVPLIVASNRCFPSVVFNYTLASLWTVLLIGMAASLIRTRPQDFTTKQLLVWAIIVMLAPLTRTSTIPIMCLCGLMVIVHLGISHCKILRTWLVVVVIPLLLSIAGSAWFYVRLYLLSGSFTGSQPEWSSKHLGRNTHLSLWQALTDKNFYLSSMAQYQNSSVTATAIGRLFVMALTVIPLFWGMMVMIAKAVSTRSLRKASERLREPHADGEICIMLVLTLAGTVFQQVLFYKQGGSANAVYCSLISIVFAVFIAEGLSAFARSWSLLTALWLVIRCLAFGVEIRLRWPFADGGTMYGASKYWVLAACCGIALVVVATGFAIIVSGYLKDDEEEAGSGKNSFRRNPLFKALCHLLR